MRKTNCHYCNKEISDSETIYFDGIAMCEDCYYDKTDVCECCGERIWSHANAGDNNIVLCGMCYEEDYTHCAQCGRIIHFDDVYYAGDDRYCSECYDHLQALPIHCYNYKPEPIFYGKGGLYMGVELEIDCGGEFDENAESIMKTANANAIHIYCKHDGSINDGFEIVSHPMTPEYHKAEMPWEKVLQKALELDYRSHQTSTCGLHIHVNRSYFGNDYNERDEAIGRVVYFVENHWNELLKFSRRTEANINRWASRYGISTTAKDTYKNAKNKCLGRYVAVNLENDSTVEFRMFRGTLRYESFIAALELVKEICKVAVSMTDSEIERMTWGDFVLNIGSDNKHLIDYLKAKRLYVNEICEEAEEE